MAALHNQLLINGQTNNPPKDEKLIIEWMTQLVSDIDMKIIQGPYASYVTKEGNRGLTAVVKIGRAHV